MLHTKTRICLWKWNAVQRFILRNFEIKMDYPTLDRKPRPYINKCRQVDFVVPADHMVKIKGYENIDK